MSTLPDAGDAAERYAADCPSDIRLAIKCAVLFGIHWADITRIDRIVEEARLDEIRDAAIKAHEQEKP